MNNGENMLFLKSSENQMENLFKIGFTNSSPFLLPLGGKRKDKFSPKT